MPLALRACAARPTPTAAGGLPRPCRAMPSSGYAAQRRVSEPETKSGAVGKAVHGAAGHDAAKPGGFSVSGVRQLMGALAFAPALRGSPYEWLIQPCRIDEACEVRRL